MEASSPRKDPKCMLIPPQKFSAEGKLALVSWLICPLAKTVMEVKLRRTVNDVFVPLQMIFQMGHHLLLVKECTNWWRSELVHFCKPCLRHYNFRFLCFISCIPLDDEELLVFLPLQVFVLLHQLQIFTLGRPLPEQPPILPPGDLPVDSRAQTSGLDAPFPKPGTEVSLGKYFGLLILHVLSLLPKRACQHSTYGIRLPPKMKYEGINWQLMMVYYTRCSYLSFRLSWISFWSTEKC